MFSPLKVALTSIELSFMPLYIIITTLQHIYCMLHSVFQHFGYHILVMCLSVLGMFLSYACAIFPDLLTHFHSQVISSCIDCILEECLFA